MYREKSHKGIQKRTKLSGTGKLMYKCPGKSHLNSSKSARRKRRLRRWSSFSVALRRSFERQFGTTVY